MNANANQSQETADLSAFRTHRAWQICIVLCAFTLLFVGEFIRAGILQMALDGSVTINNDFRIFWAAAKIAAEGQHLNVFDTDILASVHQMDEEAWMPWLYPPGYLMLVTPLGHLSFEVAWILFVVASLALVLVATWPFTKEVPALWLMATFAPAILPALLMGQNSLIWCAGLVAAFWALRGGRLILAGIFIGLLTLKPQLGLLIPVALLAIGAWRTIFAAAATTIIIVMAPTLYYGLEYWHEFFEIVSRHKEILEEKIKDLTLVISYYAFLIDVGVSVSNALKLQWGVMIASACLVFVVWRQQTIGWDLKFATLMSATMISVPYLWHYEIAMFAPIGLFLLRSGAITLNIPGGFILVMLWIGTTPIIVASVIGVADLPFVRVIAPIIAMIALAMSLTKAWQVTHQSKSQAAVSSE